MEVVEHPAGISVPRWAPDGRRLSFLSRRRGWSQVWLIDAPNPCCGRPLGRSIVPEPRPLTPSGVDVAEYGWSPDGRQLVVMSQRSDDLLTSQVHVLDVATGEERQISAPDAWEASARWLPDGSGLLLVSDTDGWFQVVQVDRDGRVRTPVTSGPIEHGHYLGGFGFAPLPSPDGTRFVHVVAHDGFFDLVVSPLAAASAALTAKHGARRSRKTPPPGGVGGAGTRINPFDGRWLAVDWLPDGSGVVAIGEGEREPEDLWILPVTAPGEVARQGQLSGAQPGSITSREPRRLTYSLPSVLPVRGFVESERLAIVARDGLTVPVTLWRPISATGKRGGTRVPAIIYAHGGPTSQVVRDWQPFRQLLVQEGFAFLAVDFRGSTGLGRAYRWANLGECGHADIYDVIDAARWAAAQPWCDGRLVVYGVSYGGYLALCALVEDPPLWKAGVDLYGDSEIAESYHHGDRTGRLALRRMMGDPDDPAQVQLYRRGSPLYRAERIEAPLLILHGRKDLRVPPRMTELMGEALMIEGKHHEIHWYDGEAHGWERRENRRDAFARIVAFLRRHVLDEPVPGPGPRNGS
jgi:dipeptidyl aminopeptidase/acylaminoacyl peptidase